MKKNLPERAQQPVIDNLEETCHGEGFLDCQDFRRLWLWLLGLRPVLSSRCSLSQVARSLVEFEDGLEKSKREAGTLPLSS